MMRVPVRGSRGRRERRGRMPCRGSRRSGSPSSGRRRFARAEMSWALPPSLRSARRSGVLARARCGRRPGASRPRIGESRPSAARPRRFAETEPRSRDAAAVVSVAARHRYRRASRRFGVRFPVRRRSSRRCWPARRRPRRETRVRARRRSRRWRRVAAGSSFRLFRSRSATRARIESAPCRGGPGSGVPARSTRVGRRLAG